MQFTGVRLVTLFTLAAVIVAIPTDPETVVPETEDLQLAGGQCPEARYPVLNSAGICVQDCAARGYTRLERDGICVQDCEAGYTRSGQPSGDRICLQACTEVLYPVLNSAGICVEECPYADHTRLEKGGLCRKDCPDRGYTRLRKGGVVFGQLLTGGLCVEDCPEAGYYPNSAGICVQDCAAPGYTRLERDGKCVQDCAAGYIVSRQTGVNCVKESPSTPISEESPSTPISEESPSTPGQYKISQDGSYEVTNHNYANDTPAPYPDTPPAPGSMGMAIGIDRHDVSRGKLPIFHWTWNNFMNSVNDMNGDDPSGSGHEFEVWVDGEIRMVPDQMHMVGHGLRCESAASAEVTVVSSSSEMEKYEDSSFSAGFDKEVDVSASYDFPDGDEDDDDQDGELDDKESDDDDDDDKDGVSASSTLQTKMMIGSSQSSKDYNAAAKSGSEMSAFATITSVKYDVFVKDTTSMSSEFTAAITKLTDDSSDANMREFFSLFGTDYLYAAKLGGKVTQQTSAKTDTSSSTQKADLAESSSTSFAFNFMSLDTTSSKAQSDTVANSKTKGFTTHQARFEGGTPSAGMEWCQSTAKHPSLVSFQTRSISSLLASTNPGLAAKLEDFLVGRLERIESCRGNNSGMQYNVETGECIVGECVAGSYQVSCGQSRKGAQNTIPTACSNNEAETACHVCEAGKFQALNEERCDDCPEGTYADETGTAMSCKSCPDGKTSDTGAASCDHLAGTYYITNDEGCSLREGEKGGGDKGLPDNGKAWAVFDCVNSRNEILIEHQGNNEYFLKYGTAYLGDADAEDGKGTGDNTHCSNSGTWGYFATKAKKVRLEAGSYSTFKIISTFNFLSLGKCGKGDEAKESNTGWAEFGGESFLKFTPAN